MDVSPAKRSYFTCANVWWKLLFHSTYNETRALQGHRIDFFAMLFRIFCIKFYRYLLFPEVISQSVPEEAARSWKQTGHWHHSAL